MANEDDPEQQIISMRDRVRASLDLMSLSLRAFNESAKGTTNMGGGLYRLDSMIGSIGKGLLGGAGAVAGMIQLGRAMEGIASQSVNTARFARDIRMTTEGVNELRAAYRYMGADAATADRNMASLGSKLRDLGTQGYNSALYQGAKSSTGGAAMVEGWMKLVREGKYKEAEDSAIAGYQRQQSADSKSRYADLLGMDESFLADLPRARANMFKITEINEAAAKKFHEDWVVTSRRLEGVWNGIVNNGLESTNEIKKSFADVGITSKTVMSGIQSFADDAMKGIRQDVKDLTAIINLIKKSPIGAWADQTPKEFLFGKPGDYPQADDPMGADYQAKGAEFGRRAVPRLRDRSSPGGLTDFGGMRRRSDNIEEQQTGILIEIRDTLQGKTGGGTSSGGTSSGGGAQYGTGGARSNLARYLGMDRTGVGAERGKLKAGDDPRGLEGYIRETAAKYGIDPDTAVAVAKSEGLRNPLGDGGRSHGAFQLFTGGGVGNLWQKANPGLDISDPANEKSTIDFALKRASERGWGEWHGARKTGIGNMQGIGGSGITPAPGGAASIFGGDVRERQGRVAGTRKGALSDQMRTALDYASSQTGLTVDVTSGGQRMPGAPGAVGSHRHDRGRAADFNLKDAEGRTVNPNDPRAIEFYRYAAQAGVTGGGHSYMSDPTKIHLDTVGSVYAGGKAIRDAVARGMREQDQFAERSARMREKIDSERKAAAAGSANSLTAKVDFSNVPAGVTTKVEKEGDIFKDVAISRSRQASHPDEYAGARYPY